jgi:hypothetical protein
MLKPAHNKAPVRNNRALLILTTLEGSFRRSYLNYVGFVNWVDSPGRNYAFPTTSVEFPPGMSHAGSISPS